MNDIKTKIDNIICEENKLKLRTNISLGIAPTPLNSVCDYFVRYLIRFDQVKDINTFRYELRDPSFIEFFNEKVSVHGIQVRNFYAAFGRSNKEIIFKNYVIRSGGEGFFSLPLEVSEEMHANHIYKISSNNTALKKIQGNLFIYLTYEYESFS